MAWDLNGNAGTTPAENFLGTTDNQPLVIRTNGAEALRIDTHANVGIKTPNPTTALHVSGSFTLDPQGTGNNDPVIFTGGGDGELNRSLQLINSPNHASASGLKAGGVLVADDYSFANPGKNDLAVKGNATVHGNVSASKVLAEGIAVKTANPTSALHVSGFFTLDPQGTGKNDSVIFTGGGSGELNRYLQLLNSPDHASASGLRAGGVLVADNYNFANPGKNDLVVKGNATVHGDVILSGADCAEDFDVSEAEEVEPGSVVVLNQEGALEPCYQEYDKRVVGVISGAGDYRPGIVLDKRQTGNNRMPVALIGKVYCKVDAAHGEIEVGDLLVTSPTPGHAMKVSDPARAFGAVIGKALRGLQSGCGLVPVLISLQ
jgi:hypothetical protein